MSAEVLMRVRAPHSTEPRQYFAHCDHCKTNWTPGDYDQAKADADRHNSMVHP